MSSTEARHAPTTRISLARVGVVLLSAAVVGVVGVRAIAAAVAVPQTPGSTVFTPYVDVTVTPTYAFETPAGPTESHVVLAFVTSGAGAACEPRWGGVYSLDVAGSELQLDRRLSQLRLTGGSAAVSFGGQRGTELATSCTDTAALTDAYRSVVDRYELTAIDLDLEGATLEDSAGAQRRAVAVRDLQATEHAAGRDLAVWVTLPVAPSGLTASGRSAVSTLLGAGVELAGVNGMAMDFGVATAAQPESTLVVQAAEALVGQVRSAYADAGQRLDDTAAWGRVGITVMIGQNDVATEQFTLADATTVNSFVREHGVGLLSMWSLNRDATCGPPLPRVLTVVQTSCSGVDQGTEHFSDLLGSGTDLPTSATTTPSPTASPVPTPSGSDDPAHSPFPIWDPAGTYPAGSKVVWQHNVYQARYWTTGFPPDTPTATAADNPWNLVGPVLPGDTPAPLPTLSPGTYPQWNATTAYTGGSRVQLGDVPYVAKWWTQGQQPGTAVAGGTPWLLIVPGS